MVNPFRTTIGILICLTTCLTVICGCGPEGKEVAPAHGTVTIDGKPMTFGRVQFSPIASGDSLDAGKPAVGYLDDKGEFTLTTNKDGDGAIVGQHRVSVSSKSRSGEDGKKRKPDDSIPKFKHLRLVGERFDVNSGQDNTFVIELTSEQIRKFGADE